MKFSKIFVLAITIMVASTSVAFSQTVSSTKSLQKADSTKTVALKVKGITCSTDLKMISANVEKLKGVSTCKARKTGPTTTFEIAYNPTLITEKEIQTAIQNTGSCERPDEKPYTIKQ